MAEPKVVLVTGASAGVGRAIALAFARHGSHVALLARESAGLHAAKAEAEGIGGRAIAVAADVASAEQVEEAAERTEREFGPIDVWVNNAMVTVFSHFVDMTPEEFDRVTDVTYHGMVHGTMSALRRMRPRNRGAIVQVGSALSYRGIPLQSAYCGAKHAVRGFTDSVRAELMHEGSNIVLTMVQLPAHNTPQFEWSRSHMPRHPQPLPPIFDPDVAARAVVFASRRRWREVHVGSSTMMTVLGQRIAPGLLERYLSRAAYDGQLTDIADPGDRPDNLMRPVPRKHGTRGRFRDRAKHSVAPYWLTTFPGLSAVGLAALLGAAAGLLLDQGADEKEKPMRRERRSRLWP